jgi:hypothetical protein
MLTIYVSKYTATVNTFRELLWKMGVMNHCIHNDIGAGASSIMGAVILMLNTVFM